MVYVMVYVMQHAGEFLFLLGFGPVMHVRHMFLA